MKSSRRQGNRKGFSHKSTDARVTRLKKKVDETGEEWSAACASPLPPVYVTSRPRIRAIENQRKGRLVTWNTIFKAGLWDLYVWWSNWHWTKEILMTLLLMSCSQSNAHFRRLVYTVYWGIWPSILKYKLSGNLVHHDNWSYLWTIGEKANFENISKYVLSDLSGVYVPASSQGWVGAAIIEAIAECSSLFALITPWQLDHKSRRSLRWPV